MQKNYYRNLINFCDNVMENQGGILRSDGN